MRNFQIEKNIQIPLAGKALIYPWREMEIGDSFLFDKDYTIPNMRSKSNAAINFCYKSKGCKEWKFAVRKVEDNKIRIWRIK